MKLRIKGNSLRLRVTQSDMARLMQEGRIEETVYFAPEEDAKLTYALEHTPSPAEISAHYCPQKITIALSTEAATQWSETDQVGISGEADTGHGPLALLVEKDFACLDRVDADDEDTFPHPLAGAVC
jgi:hypothetical protein